MSSSCQPVPRVYRRRASKTRLLPSLNPTVFPLLCWEAVPSNCREAIVRPAQGGVGATPQGLGSAPGWRSDDVALPALTRGTCRAVISRRRKRQVSSGRTLSASTAAHPQCQGLAEVGVVSAGMDGGTCAMPTWPAVGTVRYRVRCGTYTWPLVRGDRPVRPIDFRSSPSESAPGVRARRQGPVSAALTPIAASAAEGSGPAVSGWPQSCAVVRVLFVAKLLVGIQSGWSSGVSHRSVNPSRKLPRFESWICHQPDS
jgi:hypothetical protein